MNETQLKNRVLNYLRSRDIFCVKIAGGPRQAAGIADILAVLPPSGRLLAIELKAPGKPAQPTEIQARFLENVNRCGGYAVCVNSLEEVIDLVEFATASPAVAV